MIFKKSIDRYKKYIKEKEEQEKFIQESEEKKKQLEQYKKDLELSTAKVTEEILRLKLTEERILESQKEAELKLKVAQSSSNPESIFRDCLKISTAICWDLNKDITKQLIDIVREEESDKERRKYEKSTSDFLRKFNYIDNVLDSLSISKIYYNLQQDRIVAEREGNKKILESINNKLFVLKELGIVK